MSGPIVRSGPSPEYSKNWESAFGGRKAAKKSAADSKAKSAKAKKKTPKKKSK
jgi:hypothetical protein